MAKTTNEPMWKAVCDCGREWCSNDSLNLEAVAQLHLLNNDCKTVDIWNLFKTVKPDLLKKQVQQDKEVSK